MKRPLCLLCLAFVVGMIFFRIFSKPPSFSLGEGDGSPIILEGVVKDLQTKDENLILYLSTITFQNKFLLDANIPNQKTKGVICYLDPTIEIKKLPQMGSRVRIEGIAKEFKKASNPGEFHAQNYYELEGYSFSCSNAKIKQQSQEYDKKAQLLYLFKKELAEAMEQLFKKETAGIMKAVLLGEKQELDKRIKNLYQENGIAHLLAISGLHISILGMGLYRLFCKMRIPILISAVSVIYLMILYGEMTGMSSSCKRAVIMFSLQMIANLTKRTYDMLTAMACSAILILVIQPLYIYHAGFLLSFGAIMGIALLEPVITFCVPKKYLFLKGISIPLFTLPIQLFFFYEFSFVSLLLNIIVIPLMSFVVLGGSVAAILFFVLPQVARIIAFLPTLILWIYEKICIFSQEILPKASIVGMPKPWKIVFYYLLIIVVILFYKQLGKKKIALVCGVAILVLCIRLPGTTQVTFLDVGQGDSACIIGESGRVYLIDGGSSSKQKIGEYIIEPFLKYSGKKEIECIFLSHMDEDHISGIQELIGKIPIQKIAVSYAAKENNIWRELKEAASKEGIKIYYMKTGDILAEKGLRIECLAPKKGVVNQEENENSLVLGVQTAGLSILFTGDLEGAGEEKFLEEKQRSYSLLKVAHHGSKNATTEEFLKRVTPKMAVISCGKNNRYGHPHKDVLERLLESKVAVHTTQDCGAISFTSKNVEEVSRICYNEEQ